MKTIIDIKQIKIPCRIGVSDTERSQIQNVLVSVRLYINGEDAVTSDAVSDTVNYKTVYTQVISLVSNSKCRLLEALAKQVLDLCLKDTRVIEAVVIIEKPTRLPNAKGVSITMQKRRNE